MKLALGTAQFGSAYGIANRGGQIRTEEISELLRRCKEVGIKTIDTAVEYGSSEVRLGTMGVRGFDVITKIPAVPDSCADINAWLERNVLESLSRLKIDRLYGLMLHRPEQLLNSTGDVLLQAMLELKERSLVKKIGISVYDPRMLSDCFAKHEFDLVQAPLNLVDRRLVASGCLSELQNKCVEVHVRSCFLQGLLLMPKDRIPSKFAAWWKIWNVWFDWLDRNPQLTAADACLAFASSFDGVGKIVVGVDSAPQLEQLIASMKSSVTVNSFPDIGSDIDELINPSRWALL